MTPVPRGGYFGGKKCKTDVFLMCIVMMTKEGSTKIVNFLTLGAGALVLECGHISHIVEMHYFFKNLLLYSQA